MIMLFHGNNDYSNAPQYYIIRLVYNPECWQLCQVHRLCYLHVNFTSYKTVLENSAAVPVLVTFRRSKEFNLPLKHHTINSYHEKSTWHTFCTVALLNLGRPWIRTTENLKLAATSLEICTCNSSNNALFCSACSTNTKTQTHQWMD
jgi:hypothetical protein